VSEDPPVSPFTIPGESLPLPADLEGRVAAAQRQLEKDRALFPGLDVKTEVLIASDAVRAILDYAAANHTDLIAMSRHGRTGWRRTVLGSVVDRVLRGSAIPVVVFPRPHAEE
jgi:nucleotide-binding universal stress UspA family protein